MPETRSSRAAVPAESPSRAASVPLPASPSRAASPLQNHPESTFPIDLEFQQYVSVEQASLSYRATPESSLEKRQAYLIVRLSYYRRKNLRGYDLFDRYADDFSGWSEEHFEGISRDALSDLKNLLYHSNVWVSRSRSITKAAALAEVACAIEYISVDEGIKNSFTPPVRQSVENNIPTPPAPIKEPVTKASTPEAAPAPAVAEPGDNNQYDFQP